MASPGNRRGHRAQARARAQQEVLDLFLRTVETEVRRALEKFLESILGPAPDPRQ